MRRLALLPLLLAACTPSPPAPAASPSPRPSAVRATPAATRTAGPTPGPTATPSPAPTATPGPTAAPSATPTPAPSAPVVETLVAGGLDGPLPYPKAVAVAPDGTCFVQAGERVVAVSPTGTASQRLPAGRLVQPQALAAGDGGRLYAVDSTRDRVVTIAADGAVAPLAAGFKLPAALLRDGPALYVADFSALRKIDLADPAHPVTLLAGAADPGTADGPLGTNRIADPRALALHGGHLYVGDFYKVRRLVLATGQVETVAGAEAGDVDGDGGPAGPARFGRIQGLAVAHDTLYVADREFGKLRAIDLARPGFPTRTVLRDLAEPGGLAADAQGRLYLAAYAGHALLRISVPR